MHYRSLVQQKMEIFDLLVDYSPDALFLTETWLSDTSAPDIIQALPHGYVLVRVDRAGRVRGGIAIIYKQKLQCSFAELAL